MEKRVRSWNEAWSSRSVDSLQKGRSYQHISGEDQWIEEMHEHKQVREQAMKIYSKAAELQMGFCNFPVINTR